MEPVTSHAIDLIEAAYDLDRPDSDWFPYLIEAGAPLLDHGLGLFGFGFVRPTAASRADEAVIRDTRFSSLPADFPERFEAAAGVLSPEFVRAVTPPGYAGTWSEIAKGHPKEFERLVEALGFADLLGILATDPDGVGVAISAPLPAATRLNSRSRSRWQMLGAHIASAYRLRRALAEIGRQSSADQTGLPHDAEAVFDAKSLRIVDSVGRAKEANAADTLRRAARRVDRARGKLRRDDPQKALETWKALVRGRWSVVDWFDTDGRRFVLAMPNSPKVFDPRGLSEQECQVATYVLLGEPNKLIAYRLGLSQGRVSGLLKSAMHKMGAKSKAELVQKLGPLGIPPVADETGSVA